MTSSVPARLLVTGATGFVGRHLVDALAERLPGSEILLADRQSDAGRSEAGRRFVRLDVSDADQVERLIRAEQPTHIVHLAALAAVTAANADQRLAWTVNFGGTQNLALAVSAFAPECRLLYCSSAEVYGASFKSGQPLDETALPDPVNPYGAAKAAADIMLGQMARSGLRVLRLRPFNHTGPGQTPHFAIPAFASQIARIERGEQEPVIRVGDLSSKRDFLDVRDVVDAYVRAVLRFHDLPNGAVINIASGVARPLQAALDQLLSLTSSKIEVMVDPQRLRPNDTPVAFGNAARAAEWLDWRPAHAWPDTIASVLDYWRRQAPGPN
ncbi:NAD-dependent epimerase/dehydratase family protein [Rhodopseudomonas palustris]|uniref:NAD-dependent epimerase/dehydratase family protein n=1 Tax=Rhodopseudomonas palustris TaxID=1076 RepID=UPI0020CD38B1|nr:NAD-dependent epimerase/dehydratase family protein [Rhodopseudomonas palustris]MCP9627201.1 NAD-dependent epimerase/dehydratase family protein [Rhodopseudomonas palustris]